MHYLKSFSQSRSALPLILTAVAVFAPEVAFAAEEIRDVAGRLEDNLTSLKSLALMFMFFAGLVIFGLGIFGIYKDSKQPNQGHGKNGMIAILVGALLLSVPTVIAVMSSTVLGEDDARDNISVDQGF